MTNTEKIKIKPCPQCGYDAVGVNQTYHSGVKDKNGVVITVDDVYTFECSKCKFHWFPKDEEDRVDRAIKEQKG